MRRMSTYLPIAALLLAMGTTLLSCGDTSPTGEVKNTHVINLVHAHDAAVNQVHSYLEITRNNEPFDLAAIGIYNSIDTEAVAILQFVSAGSYARSFADFEVDSTRELLLELTTPVDEFQFNYLLNLPDTFSFAAQGLTDNIVRSNQSTVQLEWTASKYAHGYFVVVEPVDPGNTAAGLHEFVTSGATSTSIPISAFHNTQGFSEGNYNVWVVAYHDKPIAYPGIPFDLPDGFADNISRVGVTGRAGALQIPDKVVLTAVSIK